jgi:hypothetical protein
MARSSNNSSSFKDWLEQQKAAEAAELNGEEENVGLLTQFSSIQESFTNQLQELSGSLPEAGPLSSSFRGRITNAIYLFLASGAFAVLAIVIGLPTLIIRPTKFVLCMTISTILAASSVIVMQKPQVFLTNLLNGGAATVVPVVLLCASMIFTLYVTIFIHKYLLIIFAGAVQMIVMLYYLASFIPGGTQGVIVLVRTASTVLVTAAKPIFHCTKSAILAILSKIFS